MTATTELIAEARAFAQSTRPSAYSAGLIRRLIDALEALPIPATGEAEWGVYHVAVDGYGDVRPHDSLEDAQRDFSTCGMNCALVRRKVGRWEPVEVTP